jgi:hypothetical protein
MPSKWPEELERFIKTEEWTFAKTYAQTWPHEYLVKQRVDEDMFLDVVRHIRQHGHKAAFYRRQYTYFQQDGLVYWTMVPDEADPARYPVEDETIINRCPIESTYDYRLEHGTLPDQNAGLRLCEKRRRQATPSTDALDSTICD